MSAIDRFIRGHAIANFQWQSIQSPADRRRDHIRLADAGRPLIGDGVVDRATLDERHLHLERPGPEQEHQNAGGGERQRRCDNPPDVCASHG